MSSVAVSFVVYTVGIAFLGLVSTRFFKTIPFRFPAGRSRLGTLGRRPFRRSFRRKWLGDSRIGRVRLQNRESELSGLSPVLYSHSSSIGSSLDLDYVNPPSIVNPMTVVDVIASRHSQTWANLIRVVGIAIVLTMLTAYVAAQLNAAGKTFSGTFEGWPYSAGVLLGAGIVLLYTMVGGFRAVSWTDVVQSVFHDHRCHRDPLLAHRQTGRPQ